MQLLRRAVPAVLAALLVLTPPTLARADGDDEDYHRDFILGAPAEPSEAWLMMAGGRLYDNWFAAQGLDEPERTHPVWPRRNRSQEGATTWRCKSCHGWDYKGRDGAYGQGDYRTGIKGVLGKRGADPARIARIVRNPMHGFGPELIPDDALARLAAFISRGTYDTDDWIGPDGMARGEAARGKPVFQTVCAACHGFDGRAQNWGDDDEPGFVGTEAQANPWEVLAKIRHGHPGVEMVGLVAFDMQVAADVLAYAQTLPAR